MTIAHLDPTTFSPPDDGNHVDDALALLRDSYQALNDEFAVVSSFGSESVVLLHLASQISKDIPVLFLDTGKLFGETKRYRDQLIELLKLTNVITIKPKADQVKAEDPKGVLWANDHNKCCFIRKVIPFRQALKPYKAWASGRKRYQSVERSTLPHLEYEDDKLKVNPLAGWNKEEIKAYIEKHNLPVHPLVKDGFKSIGCMTCTERTAPASDDRSGRWAGKAKSECGIHLNIADNIRLLNRS